MRITVTLALLAAVGLTTAGAVVYLLESSRLQRDVTREVEREQQEFLTLLDAGDPSTGEPFADVGALLKTFLAFQGSRDHEMLVAYQDGRPLERSPSERGSAPLRDPAVVASLTRLSRDGGTQRLTTESLGEVWVSALPVSIAGSDDQGALVVISFLDDEYADLNSTMRTYAAVSLVTLALITGLAAWQSGRLLAPLRVLKATTEEITASDLSRRLPVSGNDDLTALTETVNGMLDRLETSFAEQQRFLDDAGHELRTPLTILAGHLELLDTGDAEDVARTRHLLSDEVGRMARLVDDLITLAKTRRPDFLQVETVDVDELTERVLAKARGLGERSWRLDAVATTHAHLDPHRVTQALLQLAENAVKHTDPGTVIALGSAVDADGVRLWVRDEGDGVPEDRRSLIFERFGRGPTRPGDDGFGLGLSLVAAIAEAHGGTVRVTSARGPGAVFTLHLPIDSQQGGHPWRAS
jgi:signal transduction histidine kinase